jgi:hypothetical protein
MSAQQRSLVLLAAAFFAAPENEALEERLGTTLTDALDAAGATYDERQSIYVEARQLAGVA